jgi:predicted metal-dependent hydrolase
MGPLVLEEVGCWFAHVLSRGTLRTGMDKGERISRLVGELVGADPGSPAVAIVDHPYYRAYFQCWNEQRYYEAHDVLEQVWLKKDTEDDDFFKGLIQAAGAFVHLQKNYEHPTHPKYSRRLRPAVRLFLLAEKNLSPFAPVRHGLDVQALTELLRSTREKVEGSDYRENPWSPGNAPKLSLR